MKYLLLLLLLLLITFPSLSYAEPTSILDVEVGFGSYTLELKYIFKDSKAPFEGYLMQPHDIAILKVDLDSYREDCEKLVEQASLQCLKDLDACNNDCVDRISIYSTENDLLLKELKTKEDLLQFQKQKTIIYSISSGLIAILGTGIYFYIIK
jgi:hypothetical protein